MTDAFSPCQPASTRCLSHTNHANQHLPKHCHWVSSARQCWRAWDSMKNPSECNAFTNIQNSTYIPNCLIYLNISDLHVFPIQNSHFQLVFLPKGIRPFSKPLIAQHISLRLKPHRSRQRASPSVVGNLTYQRKSNI